MQLEAARHSGEAQSLAVEPNTAEFSEAEGFPSSCAAESGKTRFPLARLDASEEPPEGIVQPLQRPALQVHRQFAHLGQLASALRQRLELDDVSAGLASLAIAIDPLLERRIV